MEHKDTEAKKKDIVLIACKLFLEKGYEQTSIKDIIKVKSMAKGSFFYYFSSKEELLENVIDMIVNEGVNKALEILNNRSQPLNERFCRAIKGIKPTFDKSNEIHNVENARLQKAYLKKMVKVFSEIFEEILLEGIKEGFFCIENPKEAIETVLILGYILAGKDAFGWEKDEIQKKIDAFITNVELILGAKKGTLILLKETFK